MERVGIIQSCYIPWRGYFDFIDSVDLFVVYDDVQLPQGRSWRNRNQVKTRDGVKWLTVPLTREPGLLIDEVKVATSATRWQEVHRGLLRHSLRKAPYFADAMEIWEAGIAAGDETISRVNIRLLELVRDYLHITTPLVTSRQYGVTGSKTERLISLLGKVGAKTYVSGPSAKQYLDEKLFRESGIRLEYKTYDYEPYSQLWGDFVGTVTVLDLIANMGPKSREFLKSRTPNQVTVP